MLLHGDIFIDKAMPDDAAMHSPWKYETLHHQVSYFMVSMSSAFRYDFVYKNIIMWEHLNDCQYLKQKDLKDFISSSFQWVLCIEVVLTRVNILPCLLIPRQKSVVLANTVCA